MAKVIVHPPALLSPFKRIQGAAHPNLLPPGEACNASDTANGKLLGERDAARAKAGQRVTVQAFVQSASVCYKRGYLKGLAQPGIYLSRGISIFSFPWSESVDYTGASINYTSRR